MKDYRNFIIINNDKHLITATFANCSSEVSYKAYKTFNSKKYLINNLDSLKILNKHMAQILKWKENEQALSVYYILVSPKLCKVIKNKTYKTWLESTTPNLISEEELDQWRIFNVLYKNVFADICFKPNNIYSSRTDTSKIYKHVVFTKNVIDKMHDYLDKLNKKKENTIEDLLKQNI